MPNITTKKIILCLITLMPILVNAHPGHGQVSSVLHQLEHSSLLVAIIFAVTSVVIFLGYQKLSQTRIKNR